MIRCSIGIWIASLKTKPRSTTCSLKLRILTNTAPADAASQQQLNLQLEMLRGRLQAEQYALGSSEKLQPYLDKFLPSKPFPTVLLIVSLVVLSTLLKQILSISDTLLVSSVSQTIARDMRLRIFNKALVLDRPGFNTLGISGFTTQIMQTTDGLAGGITDFYGGALNEPLRIVACLTGALVISWRLTLLSLIFAPLAAFSIVWLNRRIRGIAQRGKPCAGLPPCNARGFQFAADGAGLYDGGIRTRAVPPLDQGNAANRAAGDVLQLAGKSDHGAVRHRHAVHGPGGGSISARSTRRPLSSGLRSPRDHCPCLR